MSDDEICGPATDQSFLMALLHDRDYIDPEDRRRILAAGKLADPETYRVNPPLFYARLLAATPARVVNRMGSFSAF